MFFSVIAVFTVFSVRFTFLTVCGYLPFFYGVDHFSGFFRSYYGFGRFAVSLVGFTVLAVLRFFPFLAVLLPFFRSRLRLTVVGRLTVFSVCLYSFSGLRVFAEFCSFNRFSGCFCEFRFYP